MSEESNKPKSLRERLQSLLTAEFQGLDPGQVATVLSGVATELVQMSEAGIQTISEIESTGGGWEEHIREAGESAFPVQPVERPDVYSASANDVDRTRDLLEQILGLGVVVFATDDPPPLNQRVEVLVSIPPFHLTIEAKGKVVHHSPKGTAIELLDLSSEDIAALESIRADLDHEESESLPHVERPTLDVRNPAEESSGPWDSVPVAKISRRAERSFRRQISLTTPDARVLTSTQSRSVAGAGATTELYGPEQAWITPSGEPDRVERVAEDRVIDLLLQVGESGLTGMMQIAAKKQKFQVLVDNGLVCDIRQSPRVADEELGLMLFRADRITKQQLSMAAAHADESKVPVARSLLELGILEPEPLRQSIAGRLTYLLQRILEINNGEVSLYGGTSLPAGYLPNPPLRVHVPVERVIYRHLYEDLRQKPMKDRESYQKDALEAYPEVLFKENDRVQRAMTDEAHVDLVETLLRGRRRLQEVFTESGLSHAETFGIIHALYRMGLVRFDRSLHHTIVRERYRENVTVKYLSVHKASYFEVLNVHWSSYSTVVERAYGELVGQFDPDTVPENLEDEVGERVGEIRDRIESAYQVLAERETRHAYRKRIMPEYKLAHAIPLFLKQAELAERRRQWGDAKDALLRVLEIDPDHKQATYRFERVEAILDNRLSPDAADSNF